MPFEIKNTKDFPYFKDFFSTWSCMYCSTLKCTIKLVMHIKRSWMKSIKRLPPIQETSTVDTWATSYYHGDARVLKASSQGGDGSRWHLETRFLFGASRHRPRARYSWQGHGATDSLERHFRLHPTYNLHSSSGQINSQHLVWVHTIVPWDIFTCEGSNSLEWQYTTHRGEDRVFPGFSICRADCLFLSKLFGGGSTGSAVDMWAQESYGTVKATQTNPNTPICLHEKCTLT